MLEFTGLALLVIRMEYLRHGIAHYYKHIGLVLIIADRYQ